MIWLITIALAIICGYFLYQGFRARHIARCRYDDRTLDNLPESIRDNPGHLAFHDTQQDQTANQAPNRTGHPVPGQNIPAPHDSPSLLYAEKSEANAEPANDLELLSSVDPMDDTSAETATLDTTEIGDPANSSDYDSVPIDALEPDLAETTNHDKATVASIAPSTENSSDSGTYAGAGLAAAAAVATASAAATTRRAPVTDQQGDFATASSADELSYTQSLQGEIDLELGEDNVDEEDNDQLLDFGDLTADISEMLKELNLRESDSPRLDLNEAEYKQLKTGEPGEVKHEKIESVAGKLRNMLD